MCDQSTETAAKNDENNSRTQGGDDLISAHLDTNQLQITERITADIAEYESVVNEPKIRRLHLIVRIGLSLVAVAIFIGITTSGFGNKARTVSSDELSSESTVSRTTKCELKWSDATAIPSWDIQNPSDDLDPAIRACGSVQQWLLSASNYPDLLGGKDPMLFLSDRCYDGPRSASICRWLIKNPEFIHADSAFRF